ncbi:MAG TPA: glycosyltransferase, partial [Coleofasciculaceae cyanobacterium]
SEWFHLRMSQRHYQMCSVSLSNKIMCLTGRFSLFRAEAALHASFANQLEMDTLDDWLWGRFKFLSGDDKSTWYWLLKRGYDMIYIPDVIVYSIETISGSFADRAYQNMRRWFGNMLRNSDRAIALGPWKNGFFLWYCFIDQRISYWTSLFTPGVLLILLLQAQWVAVLLVISWILFSRSLMLLFIFWGRQSRLTPIHLPLLLLGQWAASLVKIWTQMNLAQQKWSNRGNQSISAEGSGLKRVAKIGTSRFLFVSQLFTFAVILCGFAGILNPLEDVAGLWESNQAVAQQSTIQIVEAMEHRIIPNDGNDDATALQSLINKLPTDSKIQINLPMGEIDLFHPLEINRSHIILKGAGVRRSILQTHFSPSKSNGEAAILIRPKDYLLTNTSSISLPANNRSNKLIEDVHLQSFTLRPSPTSSDQAVSTINGIVLEKVVQCSLKNLELKQSEGHSLVLHNTQDVKVEYVSTDDRGESNPIVLKEAINKQM